MCCSTSLREAPYKAGRMAKLVAEQVPGYTYGTDAVAPSPITLQELDVLKGHRKFHRRGSNVICGWQAWKFCRVRRARSCFLLAQRYYRWHTAPGSALALTRRRAAAGLPRQEQSSLRAVDSRHLLPPLRSRLAQLSAGDCTAAYKFEKEQDRWCGINLARPTARHHRIYRCHRRDN